MKKTAKVVRHMVIQHIFPEKESLPPQWAALLRTAGLTAEDLPEHTVLVWDGDLLAATGSRRGGLLQYLAVDPSRQGTDLTATVLTHLRRSAFDAGHRRLFLYTKPANRYLLQDLFFYPVAQTTGVLLMEDRPNGLRQFIDALPRCEGGTPVGALVMNCDPFTLGHRYVIEQAAAACRHVYVFILSEERSHFPAAHRLALAQAGTAHLPNVTVLPSGPYMISAATFPTYFLPQREAASQIHCELDIEIFARHIAPALGITHRYVGSEPYSPTTRRYNRALAEALPRHGITLVELPRLEQDGSAVSAGRVRTLLEGGQLSAVRSLVPETTFSYLQQHFQEV